MPGNSDILLKLPTGRKRQAKKMDAAPRRRLAALIIEQRQVHYRALELGRRA